ncbi:helix-turn-helix domain-containing protein [Lactiplantibacillus daowaiensis]|uniref:Helix-turn-helix domain-containing protein n=1 Tax=Lactiplantibacillus daowaiensis TaxID=2559918 RepID=A0ABW1RY27_9LACO|nr:helix-turn-helix transcriptional regulator [Lactiplantibacillus daowaiensis]
MTKGQRIAELRKSKNLSQVALAKALHVSSSTVGMWETDSRAIKDEDIINISNFFNVSTDYLLGKYEDINTVPSWASEKDKIDLDQYLQSNIPMGFQGIDLDKETRQKVRAFITGIFWEEKQKMKNEGKK